MSAFSMQKLRSLLPGQNAANADKQRHSVSLEPEIGFQISIETSQHTTTTTTTTSSSSSGTTSAGSSDVSFTAYQRTAVPELNVNLIAARHLPALFGFKVVQGYLIKVKLFPGSKRLDSSIQTNSWPKFNETFKFPLAPDIKRGSRTAVAEFTPEELFAGQFVVFTVYALLELPPASFNRLNKTYRSLRDKSSSLVQRVVESSSGVGKENSNSHSSSNGHGQNSKHNGDIQKVKRKPSDAANPRDAIPPLTISESRRNIGSVTCYLEPKLFQRNSRTGLYSTEELWRPIKDITTTMPKGPTNNLANSAKGVVEIVLELRDLSDYSMHANGAASRASISHSGSGMPHMVTPPIPVNPTTTTTSTAKHPQWNRMTSEMKRKMGLSNVSKSAQRSDLVLLITTARMRCSNKVKDELEANAGSVYVKTTVFEHNIYVDAWKSSTFFPSLSTKWDIGEAATLTIPLKSLNDLDNLLIRTTLATKTKMAKKLVLGTVEVDAQGQSSGDEQLQKLREAGVGERIAEWHSFV